MSSLFDYVLLFLVKMFDPMSRLPAYCNLLIDMCGLTCSVNNGDNIAMAVGKSSETHYKSCNTHDW